MKFTSRLALFAACAVELPAFWIPASAQPASNPLDACKSVQTCTAVIGSGQLSQADIGLALAMRSMVPDAQADQAMDDANRAVTILRGTDGHSLDLGKALYARSFRDEAHHDLDGQIADLNEAMQLNSSLPIARTLALAYQDQGQALYQRGDTSRAIDALNNSLKYYPDNSGAYAMRGDIYLKGGSLEQAEADYNSALRIWPGFEHARQQLATIPQIRQQRAQLAAAEEQRRRAPPPPARANNNSNALTNLILGGIAAAAGADTNTVSNVLSGSYSGSPTPAPAPQRAPVYQPPAPSYPQPAAPQANAGNFNNPANDASACLSLQRGPNNGAILFNSCGYPVEAAWCVVGTECGTGVGYMWTISANNSYPILGAGRGEVQVRYAACRGANSMDTVRGAPNDGNIHYSCPDNLQHH
ncbi:MAG TPA: tetratricopeptide repeat protein [Hyphomonadaceae bacterium]|nr:tetratricopeptide repeat protein [Hyphomonadaceae bacterium]